MVLLTCCLPFFVVFGGVHYQQLAVVQRTFAPGKLSCVELLLFFNFLYSLYAHLMIIPVHPHEATKFADSLKIGWCSELKKTSAVAQVMGIENTSNEEVCLIYQKEIAEIFSINCNKYQISIKLFYFIFKVVED